MEQWLASGQPLGEQREAVMDYLAYRRLVEISYFVFHGDRGGALVLLARSYMSRMTIRCQAMWWRLMLRTLPLPVLRLVLRFSTSRWCLRRLTQESGVIQRVYRVSPPSKSNLEERRCTDG
ncbi:MAG: hypothetical protein ACUVX8_13960 [Candidatus Zipacnadales bacterium]